MKKLLTLMLVLPMLLTLCACGEENAEPESPEETYYWRTEAMSRYPFGLSGTISAAAADGEHVFLCGVRDGTRHALRAWTIRLTADCASAKPQ